MFINRLLLFLALTSGVSGLELPVVQPSTGLIHRWVSLPGTLAPWQRAVLHAKVTGFVATITVDKGSMVKNIWSLSFSQLMHI